MLKPQRSPDTSLRPGRSNPRAIEAHSTGVAAFVGPFGDGPDNDPIRVRRFHDVERHFGGLAEAGETAFALHQFFANGGAVAYVVRTRKGAIALTGSPAGRTGMHALLDLDPYAFNVLCIPEVAHLDKAGRKRVYEAAALLCEQQRAFFICDLPATAATVSDAIAWMEGDENPRTPNGAVYFPRLHVQDPGRGGRWREVSASGTVAGIFARTDEERGVWKAPAGNEAALIGATPAVPLTDAHNRALNPRGVNAIRTLPSSGVVVWGARTLRGDDAQNDEFKYVSTRRLALHLEQSIHRGLSWAVFEPNGEPLWALIRQHVTDFLLSLYRKGAFQGATPDKAFFVRCDRSTMTESDIAAGQILVDVGFAPLKPAEFVVLRIALQAR